MTSDAGLGVNQSVWALSNHVHEIEDTSTTEFEAFDTETETSEQKFFDDQIASTEAETAFEAGVQETTEFPEDIEITFAGQTVGSQFVDFERGTDDGETEFVANADILADPSINISNQAGSTVSFSVESESLGHIIAFVEGDVYRQILGDG